MTGLMRGLAVVCLFIVPAVAHAFGGHRRSVTSSAYYMPVPVVVPLPVYAPPPALVPAPVPVQADPCVPTEPPAAAQRLYAIPTPAGPSTGPVAPPPRSPEPPLGTTPKPAVTESRSYFNAYNVAPRAAEKPVGERLPVGFWNLTNHDVTLLVDGRTSVIPRGMTLRFDLGRQFVWQVDGHEPQNERIPDQEAGVEIVIRR